MNDCSYMENKGLVCRALLLMMCGEVISMAATFATFPLIALHLALRIWARTMNHRSTICVCNNNSSSSTCCCVKMLIEAAKLSPWLTVLYANIITARNEFQYLNFEILTPQADNVLWNCNLQSNFSNDFYFQGSLLSTNVYSWFFTKGIQFKSLATPYAFSLVSNVTTT